MLIIRSVLLACPLRTAVARGTHFSDKFKFCDLPIVIVDANAGLRSPPIDAHCALG